MEVLSTVLWQAFAVSLICGGIRLIIFIFEVINDCLPQTCRVSVAAKMAVFMLGLFFIILPGVIHGLTNLPIHGIAIFYTLIVYASLALATTAWSYKRRYKRPPKS